MTLRLSFVFAALFCVICTACSRGPSGTADVPRILPRSWEITVAPFTQPRTPAQLITGSIPMNQGIVPEKAFVALNRDLRSLLQADANRRYEFLPDNDLPHDWNSGKSSGQPSALGRWVAFAKAHNAHYLLVPQVLDWHEREGSEAGVTASAHTRLEFFLIDADAGQWHGRSIFEEKQVGLIDNLFTVGDFMRRRGQWVTAGDLAIDGMKKAIKELGL